MEIEIKHKMTFSKTVFFILVFGICVLSRSSVFAQELEPRSISNAPIGTNFFALGYGYASGNVLFDPSLPIENVNAKTNALIAAYVRSFDLFGMNAKFNVILPFASGDWEGLYEGIDSSASRTGMGDMSFGLSVNFIGAPALEAKDFKNYQQKTIVGGSVQLIAPTGQYYPDKLINLGSNRWAFRPQLGVSRRVHTWYFEFFSNVWLFTNNNSFWNGKTLKQNPIVTLKTHIIKSFENGVWIALGAGYAVGGRSYVNEVKKEARISTIRTGFIAAIPIHPKHTIKLTAIVAKRIKHGADFNAFSVGYQYMWNTKM